MAGDAVLQALRQVYVLRWVAHFDLSSPFEEVWNEAFPGDPVPVE